MARRKSKTLGRQAVEEARRISERHLSSSEITASHMTIQTHWGWMVRACHPNEPEPEHYVDPKSRIAKVEAFVETPRGTNRARLRRQGSQAELADKSAVIKRLSRMRDEARLRLRHVAPMDMGEVEVDLSEFG